MWGAADKPAHSGVRSQGACFSSHSADGGSRTRGRRPSSVLSPFPAQGTTLRDCSEKVLAFDPSGRGRN